MRKLIAILTIFISVLFFPFTALADLGELEYDDNSLKPTEQRNHGTGPGESGGNGPGSSELPNGGVIDGDGLNDSDLNGSDLDGGNLDGGNLDGGNLNGENTNGDELDGNGSDGQGLNGGSLDGSESSDGNNPISQNVEWLKSQLKNIMEGSGLSKWWSSLSPGMKNVVMAGLGMLMVGGGLGLGILAGIAGAPVALSVGSASGLSGLILSLVSGGSSTLGMLLLGGGFGAALALGFFSMPVALSFAAGAAIAGLASYTFGDSNQSGTNLLIPSLIAGTASGLAGWRLQQNGLFAGLGRYLKGSRFSQLFTALFAGKNIRGVLNPANYTDLLKATLGVAVKGIKNIGHFFRNLEFTQVFLTMGKKLKSVFSSKDIKDKNKKDNIESLLNDITPEEHNLLSYAAYKDNPETFLKENNLEREWEFVSRKNSKSGMDAIVFRQLEDGEPTDRIVMSFRGTEFSKISDLHQFPDALKDVGEDVDSIILDYESDQLEDAKKYFEEIKKELDDNLKITFTGHSLGGWLATYMSDFYEKPAVTFNAGLITPWNKGDFINGYDEMIHYKVEDDEVTSGVSLVLPDGQSPGETVTTPYNSRSFRWPMDGHSIKNSFSYFEDGSIVTKEMVETRRSYNAITGEMPDNSVESTNPPSEKEVAAIENYLRDLKKTEQNDSEEQIPEHRKHGIDKQDYIRDYPEKQKIPNENPKAQTITEKYNLSN